MSSETPNGIVNGHDVDASTNAVENVKDEKSRYSNEELEEFKVLIQEKIKIKRADILNFKENLLQSSEEKPDASTHESIARNSISLFNSEKLIESLEFALLRIKNGNYGECKKCGNLIEKDRLLSVPNSTACCLCKEKANKEAKQEEIKKRNKYQSVYK